MINLIQRKQKRSEKELAESIPIFSFENDKVVFKDGRIAVGFKVQGAELESWEPSKFDSFSNSILQQSAALYEGCNIQQTNIFYDREHIGDLSNKEYFELKTQRHLMYRLILNQELYLFLGFPPYNYSKHKISPLNTLLLASKDILGNVFDRVEETLATAEIKAAGFVDGLNGVSGITMERLTEAQLSSLYNRYYTLNFNNPSPTDPLYSEMNVDRAGINVGDRRVNIVSVSGQGSSINTHIKNYLGISSAYTFPLGTHLQLPHITTINYRIENTEKILKGLDQKKKYNKNMDWMGTQDNEVMAREIDEFTVMIRENSQRIVSVGVNVMLYDNDPNLRANYMERIVSAIGSMDGSICIKESIDTLQLFMANTPGNGYNNYRWLTMSDQMGTMYFNFMDNYRSHLKGDHLYDRFRNPICVDFFNANNTNQNTIVIGETGSGKSFTVGYFIIQRHERGCRQVIIDLGGTYKNALTILNNEKYDETYFEYDPLKPISFAPFYFPKTDGIYQLSIDRSNFLMNLLFTIWKGEDAHKVKPVEKSVMKSILREYYEYINETGLFPKMSSFYDFCKSISTQASVEENTDFNYFDIVEFLTVIRPFHDGEYQEILNSENNIKLSSYKLVCFDLGKIKGDTITYPIVAQLIIQMVLDQLSEYPDDEKYIYMEEAWSLLHGTMSEFMETMFRTIRKMKGAIYPITQTVSEILKSSVGDAILGNAYTKILLAQNNPKDLEKTAAVFGLTSHQKELFASLRKEKDFREILVVMGDLAKVFILEPTPHHAAVLSSKPDERNEFVRLIDKMGNKGQAIEEFVDQKLIHNGGI